MAAIDLTLSEHETQPLPGRVWAAMLGLYAIVMIALFSAAAPGDLPIAAHSLIAMTFVVTIGLAAMIIMMLGVRADAPRVVAAALVTTLLAITVMLALQWADRHDAAHADTSGLLAPWNWIDHLQNRATRATDFAEALLANVLGVAIFEETIKLLPAIAVFASMRRASTRGFMLGAALGGLIYGVVESTSYSQLVHQRHDAAAWVYVVRFGVAAPAHAFWSAIGAAVAAALLRARYGKMASVLTGLAVACLLHGLHNATQSAFGPVAQIPSVFAAMLLLFVAVRWAWRADLCRCEDVSRTMSPCGSASYSSS
jgi:RsiW-degrading membrane proteinase PrsW (M82 family)